MRRLLKFLGSLAGAVACSYLGHMTAAFLLFAFPRLLLAATTAVEIQGVEVRSNLPLTVPSVLTQVPARAPAWLYALHAGGLLLWGAGFLALATLAARRARGWRQVFLLHVLLWLEVLVLLYSLTYVVWTWGPVYAGLRALWPAGAASWPVRISFGIVVSGLATGAAYAAVGPLLDRAAATRLARLLALVGWLVVPAALATTLILVQAFSWRALVEWELPRWILGTVTLLVLLLGVPAALRSSRPVPPLRLGVTGGAVAVAVFGLTLGSLFAYDDIVRWANSRHLVRHESQYWRLHFDETAASQLDLPAFAAAADQRLAAMAARLGLAPPNPPLPAYFYASADAKARMVRSDAPFTQAAGGTEIHHLLAPAGGLTDARGDALLLMRQAWGRPGSEILARALARYAVGDFYGYPLADYAARITREEEPYSLRDVFQLDTIYLSPLVCDALAGAWVEFLVEQHGRSLLPALYRAPLEAGQEETFARTLGTSWEELEREWREYLEALAERTPPRGPRSPPQPFFHRGITLAHEFGGYWGYGSERAREQLVRIRALGANAVAIVPYGWTAAPREPFFNFRLAETDDRVIRAIEQARARGLRVSLKPQLWARGFTGHIRLDDDAAFARWFAQYRRWLLHYARLAELHGVDLLIIGTELGGVTRHEAAWRALVADLRRIYSGPLTYAAHWGEDFETLPFWDALDYLGVNLYYPLAEPGETPRVESARVRALGEKMAAMAARYGKPVLFTEVGYPANPNAAVEPWSEEDARLDVELQARCYQVVFEAFYQQPWLAGLYWWKWPSHGIGSPYNVSYNPLGKPAEEVLRRWYGPQVRQEIGQAPSKRVHSSN